MRKEVILAVIFGSILGGVILYGLKIANQTSNNQGSSSITSVPTQKSTPTQNPNDKSTLAITYPENHAVFTSSSLTLKGLSAPNASIAITTESGDFIIDASSSGSFELPITLIGGENEITITSLNSDNSTQKTTLTLIYSSQLNLSK